MQRTGAINRIIINGRSKVEAFLVLVFFPFSLEFLETLKTHERRYHILILIPIFAGFFLR